ncbi:MAG TPA: CPBP family intramembrane metalloprotease [Anaerolineae bacterium]|nr:CPBP family intramembrane metalloprotease [Anaerolineae bacterium]
MSGYTHSNALGSQGGAAARPGLALRSGAFAVFLACALAIWFFGSNYYPAFRTNGSAGYSAGLTAAFLLAALLLRRSTRTARYWSVAYAFFVASAVLLVSSLLAGQYAPIARSLGVSPGSNQGQALQKVYEALLVSVPILLLVRLSGAGLGSLLIRRGNLRWGVGIGALVLVDMITSALIFYGTGYRPDQLGSVIGWGLVFALFNGFLEELWLRALFLERLVPLIGPTGAVLLTSAWFAALHSLAVAYMPAAVVPIFVLNTLMLGLACGILMLKTGSIWGAFLIHAGTDFFLFLALLAVQ